MEAPSKGGAGRQRWPRRRETLAPPAFSQESDMNPRKASTGGRDMKPGEHENDTKNKATPSPEVQMEDAGTPASGNSGMGGRGNAAQGAMTQPGKTSAEGSGKPERR